MAKLPKKPSDLIEIALKDLCAVERDSRYRVNMNTFHEVHYTRCEVCFGGAVMAKSLKVPTMSDKDPGDLAPRVAAKILALDHFRDGSVSSGLEQMKLEQRDGVTVEDREIVDYSVNKGKFKKQMAKMASDLRLVGL